MCAMEPESVKEVDQALEPQVTPEIYPKQDATSEREKPPTLLVYDARRECENKENENVDHSITNYTEMLEEEHRAMRYDVFEFQKKLENLSFIKRGLEELQLENEELREEIASMQASASESEKQCWIMDSQFEKDSRDPQIKLDDLEKENKSFISKLPLLEQTKKPKFGLSNKNTDLKKKLKSLEKEYQNYISLTTNELQSVKEDNRSLKSELDVAMETLTAKLFLLGELRSELHNLKKQQEENAIQQKDDDVKKRIESSHLISQNEDLKKKLQTLEKEYQKHISLKTYELSSVTEDNCSLRLTLDLTNETLRAKLCLLEELKIELQDFKIKHQEEHAIQQENDDLKEKIALLQKNESKLCEDAVHLKSTLDVLHSEKHIFLDGKNVAEQSLQQEAAVNKENLAAIGLLKFELQLANNSVSEKQLINEKLQQKISDLNKINNELKRQGNEMKLSIARLEESVYERESDWRSSEFKLKKENDELQGKLEHLQTGNQILVEENRLVRSELQSANQEREILREIVAEREQNLIEVRREAEFLHGEIESVVEEFKTSHQSMEETIKLAIEDPASNQLLTTENHQPSQKISSRIPSSKSDSEIEIDRQPGESIGESRTKLHDQHRDLDLRFELPAKDDAELESRKAQKMKNQLSTEKNEAANQTVENKKGFKLKKWLKKRKYVR